MRISELRMFAPGGKLAILSAIAENFDVAERAGISTPLRICHFMAQIAHESAGFRTTREYASGAAYDTGSLAKRLGNTQAKDGDGQKYKGRGLIQLTGRDNYEAAGKALNLPLVSQPAKAEEARVLVQIAVWYWTTRKLNQYADKNDIRQITRRINGGYNGLADRRAWFRKAVAIWGDESVDVAGKPFVQSRTVVAAGVGAGTLTATSVADYAYTGSTVVQTGRDVSEAFGIPMLPLAMGAIIICLIGYIIYDRWFIRKYERV